MSPLLCPPVEKDDNKGGSLAMSSGLKANFENLKKRKLDEASAQKVAEETAQLVESELQKLRNSVAELEALLAAREGVEEDDFDDTSAGDEDEVDDFPEKNPFPILPPDVVAIPDSGFVGSDGESDDDDLDSDLDEVGDGSD